MLAGRYPSEEFAGLRPRLVWDRTTGHAARPAGRPAAGRDQRRHDPRPRPVRRVPGRRRSAKPPAGTRAGSASWTRRWSTSRGSATCSCSARAPGGSRTSPPTRCWSRPRRASRAGCRSGTATRRAGRPSSAGRSAQYCRELGAASPDEAAAAAARATAWTSWPRRTWSATWPSSARRPATCPTTGPWCMERFRDELGRLAAGAAQPVRRAGARARGRWPSRPGCASATRAWTCRRCTPTTGS